MTILYALLTAAAALGALFVAGIGAVAILVWLAKRRYEKSKRRQCASQ